MLKRSAADAVLLLFVVMLLDSDESSYERNFRYMSEREPDMSAISHL
jgi:hypothetical protein